MEKGGNADPALDAIQDGDYYDLLDQNGGPEGFFIFAMAAGHEGKRRNL